MYELIIGFLVAVSLYGLFFTFLYLFKENNLMNVSRGKIKKSIKILILTTILLAATVIILFSWSIYVSSSKETPCDYIAKFDDASSISTRTDLYYKGVKVGKVTDLSISEDARYALASFVIENPNVRLYKGTKIGKFSNGLGKDLKIILPEKYENKDLLPKGSILIEHIDDDDESYNNFMKSLLQGGKLQDLVNNLDTSFKNVSILTNDLVKLNKQNEKELNSSIKNMYQITNNLNSATKSINGILSDQHNIENISSALDNINKSAEKSVELIDKSTETVGTINQTTLDINNTLLTDEFKTNLTQSTESFSAILNDVQQIAGDESTQNDIKDIIHFSNTGLQNLNCLTTEIGRTMTKRFLIPRMILGKPGDNINVCLPEIPDNNEKTDR
ncbi:MAG: MlaD family protein [Cyanobacteriota bacterium]